MDLVEDYLRAVAALLPKAQRDDIVAELRDIVLTRLEARQAELGHPPTDAEIEDVLREIGHPLVVAGRYREGPQTIVESALYPFWLFAVKAAIGIQVCVAALILIVRVASGANAGQAMSQAFASLVTGSATLIGFITAAAWLIERQPNKPEFLTRWRVKDLKLIELGSWDLDDWRTRLAAKAPSASAWKPLQTWRRSESQAGRGLGVIVGTGVFLLWWAGALHFGLSASPDAFRLVGLEPGELSGFDWTALKAQVFWPVAGYALVAALWGFSLLARPFARRVHGGFDLVLGVSCLALVAWLASATPLSVVLTDGTPPELAFDVLLAFRSGPPFPLWAALVVAVAGIGLVGVVRLVRGAWLMIDPAPSLLGRHRPA